MKNKISKLDSTVTNSTKTVRELIRASNESIKEEMVELKSNTTKVIGQIGMNEISIKDLAAKLDTLIETCSKEKNNNV